MARKILDLAKDTLNVLMQKVNDNFSEVYQQNSDQSAQLSTKANQSDVDTLSARVNNIIANSSSTEGNSELIDIRVGEDGTQYSTAGEAVRMQDKIIINKINKTSDNFARHLEYSNLKFDKFTNFEVYLQKCIQDGIEKDASGFICNISSFIPVIPHETICANYRGYHHSKYYGVNFYDSSKQFIGFIEKDFPTDSYNPEFMSLVEIPDNCFYVRFQWLYSNNPDVCQIRKICPKLMTVPTTDLLQNLVEATYKVNIGEYIPDNSIQIIDNTYLNTGGKPTPTEGWYCTDWIDVYKFSMIYISNNEPLYGNPSICFYDEFKNFVGSLAVANTRKRYTLNEIFSTASTTRYVRVASIGEVSVETIDSSKLPATLEKISTLEQSSLTLSNSVQSLNQQVSLLENSNQQMDTDIAELQQTGISVLSEITAKLHIENGYITKDGEEISIDSCYRTSFIALDNYDKVWFSGGWNQTGASAYAFYDENQEFIESVESTLGGSIKLHELNFKNFLSDNPQRKYIKIVSYYTEMHISAYTKAIINDEVIGLGNILYGKKYVSCGDSFTAGDFSGGEYPKEEYYDSARQTWKTYPYFIAKRNNMFLVNEAISGSTMYNNGDPNAFSINRYKEIPTDADYITLQFGLNDGKATIGTISDTDNTTEMGAWNVVLKYLINNHPYAKIGIIISDAWLSAELRAAIIQCAESWGIPYLDMRGSTQVPLGIGGKLGISIQEDAITARNLAFQVSTDNGHPNPKAHEYRSTFIENFMRSL